MRRCYNPAGLNQLGPIRDLPNHLSKPQKTRKRSITTRASLSTKRRKVKITLAEHA